MKSSAATWLLGSLGVFASGCDCGGAGDVDAGGGRASDVQLDAALDPSLDARGLGCSVPSDCIAAGFPVGSLCVSNVCVRPPPPDAFVPEGVDANMDALIPGVDAGADASLFGCRVRQCNGRTYECGNCMDDDGDGRADSADANCLGPCDNTEDSLDLGIPGGETATCNVDCYFDEDQGPGNDGCRHNTTCDPLAPEAPICPYDPSARCPMSDERRCGTVCGPLVPNGCDCFGCCEFPARSGNFVFLGSVGADGMPSCSADVAGDPSRCHRCTPQRVEGCFNPCGRCELCFGATELPPECRPRPDAGPPDAAPMPDAYVAPGVDASFPDAFTPPPSDAGVPPGPRCAAGQQACGLPGDAECPASWYCITGCCVQII